MSAKASNVRSDLKRMSSIAAAKLREATTGDEVWLEGRKTPITINNRNEKADRVVFNAKGNGYDYVLAVANHGMRGECVRFPSRGSAEDLTDDVQGVRHTDD